jgi:DUF2075 family protein
MLAAHQMLAAIKVAYRVLLIRAMKSIVIWCEDQGTRVYLAETLAEEAQPIIV